MEKEFRKKKRKISFVSSFLAIIHYLNTLERHESCKGHLPLCKRVLFALFRSTVVAMMNSGTHDEEALNTKESFCFYVIFY